MSVLKRLLSTINKTLKMSMLFALFKYGEFEELFDNFADGLFIEWFGKDIIDATLKVSFNVFLADTGGH